MKNCKNKFLIIAGSEKCGTTSLFQYLADSSLFNVSKKKETDFFRSSKEQNLETYLNEFAGEDNSKIFLEASPGYLSESEVVAPRMAELLDDYYLVFCLRDPIERLKSNFVFRKSRLYIDADISFDYYVEQCFKFTNGEDYDKSIDQFSLEALDAGKYHKKLMAFKNISNVNLLLVIAEELNQKPSIYIKRILDNINVKTDFYNEYVFGRNNVTTGFKNSNLQKLALSINKKFEFIWYKFPNIKKRLLALYNKINGANKEKVTLSEGNLRKIKQYYHNDILKLEKELLGRQVPWKTKEV